MKKKKQTFKEKMTERMLKAGLSQKFINSNMEFLDDLESDDNQHKK